MELPALIALVEVYRIRIILERFPAHLIHLIQGVLLALAPLTVLVHRILL